MKSYLTLEACNTLLPVRTKRVIGFCTLLNENWFWTKKPRLSGLSSNECHAEIWSNLGTRQPKLQSGVSCQPRHTFICHFGTSFLNLKKKEMFKAYCAGCYPYWAYLGNSLL